MGRADPFLASLGLNVLWRRRTLCATPQAVPEVARAGESVRGLAGTPVVAPVVTPSAMAHEAQAALARPPDAAGVPVPASVPARGAEMFPEMPPEALPLAALDLAALRARVAGCTACRLCESRTQTVFGVGDEQADWMIVGEGPGANEDQQGEPFVGQAGKLLDNMLRALDLSRGSGVFIANVVKCRPPGNRDPQPDEVAACEGYLRRQIDLVKPRIIVALGRFAAQTLLCSDAKIGTLRGTVHTFQDVPVVVTYHPAYLLRSLGDKAKAWEDLCLARATYRAVREKDGNVGLFPDAGGTAATGSTPFSARRSGMAGVPV